ncbi:MAG: hypothetical protein K2H85_10660 [Allobaculum sp.]|nr:hypothetical protein [Allobaculum sp.]
MMTVNEAMLFMASKLATEWGYIHVGTFDINAINDSFWGNQYLGLKAHLDNKPEVIVNACEYIYPVPDFEQEAGKKTPRIEIDMHFGEPRLSVRKTDDTFACLTYKDGIFSEGQAFKEKGPALLIELKNSIDALISK